MYVINIVFVLYFQTFVGCVAVRRRQISRYITRVSVWEVSNSYIKIGKCSEINMYTVSYMSVYM